MDAVLPLLPKIGAGIMLLVGLVSFFKPRLLLDQVGITMNSAAGVSEARAVFGGLNLGLGLCALIMAKPEIYVVLGITWGVATLARFWSLAVDGIGVKGAVPGVVVDGTFCLLFLAPFLFG